MCVILSFFLYVDRLMIVRVYSKRRTSRILRAVCYTTHNKGLDIRSHNQYVSAAATTQGMQELLLVRSREGL